VDAFFTDPSTQPPPQQQQDPKLQIELMKVQAQQQLQDKKIQQEAVHEQAKFQADAALEQQKFEHQRELDFIEMGMKREEHQSKMQLATHQAKLSELQAGTQLALAGHKAETDAKAAAQPKQEAASPMIFAGDKGAESVAKGFTGGFKQLGDHMTKMHEQNLQAHKQTADAIGTMLKHASAPRKIIRGKDGKISHVETSH
jgi:hypothetical protein